MSVLHLDNIVSSHPGRGDKNIVGVLDADEVLHDDRKPAGCRVDRAWDSPASWPYQFVHLTITL